MNRGSLLRKALPELLQVVLSSSGRLVLHVSGAVVLPEAERQRYIVILQTFLEALQEP